MALQKDYLPNKGTEFRNYLLSLDGEHRNGDYLLVSPLVVKIKWHSVKQDSDVWTEMKVVRASTNCFMAHPFDLPFWSVLEYNLGDKK